MEHEMEGQVKQRRAHKAYQELVSIALGSIVACNKNSLQYAHFSELMLAASSSGI